jgi:hypothetical protein
MAQLFLLPVGFRSLPMEGRPVYPEAAGHIHEGVAGVQPLERK